MIDATNFKPKTVYVTYIATTPEKVWQALTDPAFSKQYFFGFADRKSTRLNSSHTQKTRMPSSA